MKTHKHQKNKDQKYKKKTLKRGGGNKYKISAPTQVIPMASVVIAKNKIVTNKKGRPMINKYGRPITQVVPALQTYIPTRTSASGQQIPIGFFEQTRANHSFTPNAKLARLKEVLKMQQ